MKCRKHDLCKFKFLNFVQSFRTDCNFKNLIIFYTKATVMAKIKFTTALKRFFPHLKEMQVQGHTLQEVLNNVEKEYPGISGYLFDDSGSLRKHVNIFLGGRLIEDRDRLSDPVAHHHEILVFQALSGG